MKAKSKGQSPRSRAQSPTPAVVEHQASLLCAWLTLALLVAGCVGSRTTFSKVEQKNRPVRGRRHACPTLKDPHRIKHRLDAGDLMRAE